MAAASSSSTLIPIHSDGDIQEWMMLEINGELILPKESLSSDKENPNADSVIAADQVELGAVHFHNERPVMVLGSHELSGKLETLKQPFCILQRHIEDNDNISYKVKGVVTRKLLFNQYPKIIMR